MVLPSQVLVKRLTVIPTNHNGNQALQTNVRCNQLSNMVQLGGSSSDDHRSPTRGDRDERQRRLCFSVYTWAGGSYHTVTVVTNALMHQDSSSLLNALSEPMRT